MTRTKTTPKATTECISVYEIVTCALLAKGRLQTRRSVQQLGNGLDDCDIVDLYLERHPAGWVANIAFDNPVAGAPNTVGTPDASPYPTPRLAFFAGASMLCELLTGSRELPFIEVDGKLLVVSYDTGGNPELFGMTRPLPWT